MDEVDRLRAELAALRAERDRLRAAIERVWGEMDRAIRRTEPQSGVLRLSVRGWCQWVHVCSWRNRLRAALAIPDEGEEAGDGT